MTTAQRDAVQRAKTAFLRACTLDVAVRKPGNVSMASAGHGMQAALFIDSARAAADPMFTVGASVGVRIEGAVQATLAVAGCNTNLGIVLLCAPIAKAVELHPEAASTPAALREAIESVLAGLSLEDARGAYRAIALANPGGLGAAETEDVHDAPSIDLRAAMALAADRDLIARQYRDGYADVFEHALPALGPGFASVNLRRGQSPDPATVTAVQKVYLELLSSFPDSHIVRKHGEAVAQTVMTSAQAWRARAAGGAALDAAPGFAAWDESLKSQGINPGTSADLTVATLTMAGLSRMAKPRRES